MRVQIDKNYGPVSEWTFRYLLSLSLGLFFSFSQVITAPWVYVVGRFRLLYHGLAWVLSNPCILPETRVQLGIELGVTSSGWRDAAGHGHTLLNPLSDHHKGTFWLWKAEREITPKSNNTRPPTFPFLIQLKLLLVICLVSIKPWVVNLFPGNSVYFRDIMERMERVSWESSFLFDFSSHLRSFWWLD